MLSSINIIYSMCIIHSIMYLEQELMDLQTKMSFTATENPLSVWLYSLGGYSAKLAF